MGSQNRALNSLSGWLQRADGNLGRWLSGLALSALVVCGCSDAQQAAGGPLRSTQQALTTAVPHRVKSLDFTAFQDSDTTHEGNCGSGPVDAEITSDPNGGGCDVGWTHPGEWLEYSIQAPAAAKYDVTARVASGLSGKTFRLSIDGVDLAGSISVPSSGWQSFADRSVKDVSLTAGSHTVRVSFETGDTNLNYLDFAPGTVSLPARIEAESYQRANESTPSSNSGGACDRGDGVDEQTTGDSTGVCNVGWTTAGEWLEYDVSVASGGSFDIKARAGTGVDGRTLTLSVDGTATATANVAKTSWTAFEDVTFSNVSLATGPHTIRITFPQGDTNLNYLDFVSNATPVQPSAMIDGSGTSFGAAAGYNLFLFQDLSTTPNIAGPVAAGRDITASSFGYDTSASGSIGVLVGRNFTGSNGSVHRDLVYGGTLSLTNVGVLQGTTRHDTPVDFSEAKTNLEQLSANLFALPSGGMTTIQSSTTISFSGSQPALNVFSVSGSALATTDVLQITVPTSSTVVINVSGTSAVFDTTGIQLNGLSPGNLIWNFPSATSLRLSLSGLSGTFLAPEAAVTQSSSTLDGVLVATSLTGGDNGLTWKPFTGHFPWTPSDPSGAVSGSITIHGRVLDSSGTPIVGARIDLTGGTTATRYSDFSGSYAFHVSAGSYSLWASGSCAFSVAGVNLGNVSADTSRDFSATSAGCVSGTASDLTASGEVVGLKQGSTLLGRTQVFLNQRASSADSLTRLQQIADEQLGAVAAQILGNAAIERQVQIAGADIVTDGEDDDATGPELAVTTAIAVTSTVARFESRLDKDADANTINRFVSAGRNFDYANQANFHGGARAALSTTQFAPTVPATLPVLTKPSILVSPSELTSAANGEVEVAATDSGTNAMVTATVLGPFFSWNGGQTTFFSDWHKTPPAGATTYNSLGDPSVTIGAPDANHLQTFYATYLAQVAPGCPGNPAGVPCAKPPTVAIGLYQSTDNGQTFVPSVTAFPLNCGIGNNCVVPDQAQLVADRHNRVTDGTGTHDQLYLAWRNYAQGPKGLSRTLGLACSTDGGATWSFDKSSIATSGVDYPRLSVAPNGDLLVAAAVTGVGGDPAAYDLSLYRYTQCSSMGGMTLKPGFPAIAGKARNPVPLAGMPRQPSVNYSVTASEADPLGNRVLVALVDQLSPNSENVIVASSTDGGLTYPSRPIINTNSTGDRFFPWICNTGSTDYVTWYDRRAGGDKTGFYRRALVNDSTLGTETNMSVNGHEDPQCLTGFPGHSSSTPEAETSCTDLPNVNLGVAECLGACPAGTTGACAPNPPILCDYRPSVANACAAGQTCGNLNSGGVSAGSPKYGDYMGTACARGRLFATWATGVPPGQACKMRGLACTTPADCCSGDCVGGVCYGNFICGDGGAACSKGPDCCSGTCTAGACTGLACTANGTACTRDAECCSLKCNGAQCGACVLNGTACVNNNDCCSGNCEGGQCFAAVGLYSTSTGCTGVVGEDPNCGPVNVTGILAANGDQIRGPRICGKGSGFTAGGNVTLTLSNIPGTTAPKTFSVGTADALGKVAFTDDSQQSVSAISCTFEELNVDVTAVVTDVTGGGHFQTRLSPCLWCGSARLADGTPVQLTCSSTNGGGCPIVD